MASAPMASARSRGSPPTGSGGMVPSWSANMINMGSKWSTGMAMSPSANEAKNERYLSSRNAMITNGIPECYTDAILDVGYMETLLKSAEHIGKKRKQQMDRYVRMNQSIVVFLVAQALLGVWLALYGTVLAPRMDFSTLIELEDADLVIMLDGSNHLGETFDEQRNTVKNFTHSLYKEISDARDKEVQDAKDRLFQMKKESRNAFQKWFDGVQGKEVQRDDSGIEKYGGWMRISTHLFNSAVQEIHSLTYSQDEHQNMLDAWDTRHHAGDSQWEAAIRECKKVIGDSRTLARSHFTDPQDFRLSERCYTRRQDTDPTCDSFNEDKDKLRQCPGRYCNLDAAAGELKCVPRPPFCRKQFCIILGDSDAMCKKRVKTGLQWEAQITDFCAANPGRCPSTQDLQQWGNPVEWAPEMQECEAVAQELAPLYFAQKAADAVCGNNCDKKKAEMDSAAIAELNKYDDITLIMMFTASTYAERQMRLKSNSFRAFVKEVLNCYIDKKATTMWVGGSSYTFDEYFINRNQEGGCLQFVMETEMSALLEQAKQIKKLLKFSVNDDNKPSSSRDNRWAFFLLLVLNIPLYLGWTYIVRWYSTMQVKTARIMGEKKKMIKVTKTVMEKDVETLGGAGIISSMDPALQEIELEEFQKSRVPLDFGADLSLRSRLKGTYLRNSRQTHQCDGNGKAFDRVAGWSFEPADDTAGQHVSTGTAFHIRNNEGKYLCATETGGTKFVDDVADGGPGATTFVCMPAAVSKEADNAYVGDVIRLKNNMTGKFVGCKKDGTVNCLTKFDDPESQFVVDSGGQPITDGALVTLHADAAFAFLNTTPEGETRVGDVSNLAGFDERDWRSWMIEKVVGFDDAAKRAGTSGIGDGLSKIVERTRVGSISAIDNLITRGALKEGDTIRLKGFNQRYLMSDSKTGKINSSKYEDEDDMPDSCTQEYTIHRIGLAKITKHNNTIRRGAQICLKPVWKNRVVLGTENMYAKVTDDGMLEAAGQRMDKEICITIDFAPFMGVVAPLTGALEKGDAKISWTSIGNKTEEKSCQVATAAWTTEEDMGQFRGLVVAADEGGAYSPPKAAEDWVLVIPEGVDIYAAAARAKKQGAKGIIVRSHEPCSQDSLALGADGISVPELPCVYVSESHAEALLEKGLTLKGAKIEKQYMTDLMRSIGRLRGPETFKDVFSAAGTAMIERWKELQKFHEASREKEREMKSMQTTEGFDEQGKNFKWKVNANTQYYWAKGGGGANAMKVNYGKKAPPSAHKQEKFDEFGNKCEIDASNNHDRVIKDEVIRTANGQKLYTQTSHIPAEEVRNLRLAEELVVLPEDIEEHNMETLDEESDFKIDYKFEEIEVGVGEKAEDLDEEAYMEDAGMVIKTVGVPKKQFWIVGLGLLVSTIVLLIVLLAVLKRGDKNSFEDRQPLDVKVGPGRPGGMATTTTLTANAFSAISQVRLPGFLSSVGLS